MRLLRVDVQQFDEYPSHGPFPRYAILSHTWLSTSEEVTYQDLSSHRADEAKAKAGWRKIQYTIEQAREDGFSYVWVDTCCINKLDPTELTEAINSMYNWYAQSACCYAYLADIDRGVLGAGGLDAQLGTSQWFTRGWTLQELIAPNFVKIYDRNWLTLTTRAQSATEISAITRIHPSLLEDPQGIGRYSIANRMSWAAGRRTSRAEDRAYSLLGIFGIVMPLHYGEGEEHAFKRLQQEIIRQHADRSILAWEWPPSMLQMALSNGSKKQAPFLAPSPDCFKKRGHVIPARSRTNVAYSISNVGLEIETYLVQYQTLPEPSTEGSRTKRRPHKRQLILDLETPGGLRRLGRSVERAKPLQDHDTSFVGAILDCSSSLDPSMIYMLPLSGSAGGCYTLAQPLDCLEVDWLEAHMQMEPLNSESAWQKITILRNPFNYEKENSTGRTGLDNVCAKVRLVSVKCPNFTFTPCEFWPPQSWNIASLAFLPHAPPFRGAITFRCVGDHGGGRNESFISIAFDCDRRDLSNIHVSFEAPTMKLLENLFVGKTRDRGDEIREMIISPRLDVAESSGELKIHVVMEHVDTPCDGFSLVKVIPELRNPRTTH